MGEIVYNKLVPHLLSHSIYLPHVQLAFARDSDEKSRLAS